ncbi:hypothetical protein DERP_003438 [Dermatophagoides pteronyssinus]|uniref:Uncharacterized protein n=1 Tax=Dermatophagoides pteronyssinus TaxID=6956 RepID=A0ABQ8JJY0_DERPT|nr:hypothetical protein DERP_003438 [Dermatophagoides pteronyssinus]
MLQLLNYDERLRLDNGDCLDDDSRYLHSLTCCFIFESEVFCHKIERTVAICLSVTSIFVPLAKILADVDDESPPPTLAKLRSFCSNNCAIFKSNNSQRIGISILLECRRKLSFVDDDDDFLGIICNAAIAYIE